MWYPKALVIAAVLVFGANGSAPADEPGRRAEVTVRGSVSVAGAAVRLGDVFANTGELADKPIARAPRPGQRVVLDARTLYRLASAHGVPWQPSLGGERIVLERESDLLTEQALIDYVRAAMGRRGLDPRDLEISLGDHGEPAYVAANADVGVTDLRYDETGGRFSAVLTAEAPGEAAQRIGLVGRAHRVVRVPVLRHPLRHGEVIGAADIAWREVRQRRVPDDVILDADFLVGLTPRRVVRADQPIRPGDLGRPILVERNARVTIVLRTPTMVIAMQGKALEDAAEGQTVRVRNERGRTVVEGVVTARGDVILRTDPPATVAR